MTASSRLHIALTLAFAWGCASFQVQAQEQVAPDPASSTPKRPVILQMTPGSKLGQPRPANQDAVKPQKPRIIPVSPNAQSGASAVNSAARALKAAPNDYSFCNQTSYVLSIAVGLKTGPMIFTRGWWPLAAGECKVVIKGPLSQSTYYSFARSSFAHMGPIRTWGGTHNLCTGKVNFQASGGEDSQCGPGYTPLGFAAIDIQGKSGWSTTLSESSKLKTSEDARIAGFQRLLFDIGLFEGAIDGVPGPKYSEAMTQARTALSAGPDNASLYAKLVAEATRLQAVSGLTFCNRTQTIIWTAYGREVQGKAQSRGWYRLLPEQCEKVIKERLVEPILYAFASVDKTDGLPQTWGGNKIFCSSEASFDFDDSTNCSGKGFTGTGFFPIDTNGKTSVTFEFIPRNEPAEGN